MFNLFKRLRQIENQLENQDDWLMSHGQAIEALKEEVGLVEDDFDFERYERQLRRHSRVN